MTDRLEAGRMRQRITILRPTGTPSATGGTIAGDPETVAANLPAVVESTVLGAETIQAGQVLASVTHHVGIRYLAGIKNWMIVTLGDRTLQILAVVDVDDRHLDLWLLCAEV